MSCDTEMLIIMSKTTWTNLKKLIAWRLFLVLLWSYIVGVQMAGYAIGVLYYFMAFFMALAILYVLVWSCK